MDSAASTAAEPENDMLKFNPTRKKKPGVKIEVWPFFDYVRRESDIPFKKLAFTAGVAGLSNVLILATVNSSVKKLSTAETGFLDFLALLVVILVYVVAQGSVMVTATHGVERMVHRIRSRISAKIAACDLVTLENAETSGRGAIFGSVSRDTGTISDATISIVMGLQFAIVLVLTAIYVTVINLKAFLIVAVFTSISLYLQTFRRKQFNEGLHAAAESQNQVFELINHLLEGLKEVKMSRERRVDLLEHIWKLSETARDKRADSMSILAKYFVFAQASFYTLLGVIVYIMPRYSDMFHEDIYALAATILFMMGPVQGVAGLIPNVETVTAAFEDIEKVENLLDESIEPAPDDLPSFGRYQAVALHCAEYSYLDRDGLRLFHLGPVDIDLKPGQIVMLTGGNGSGKSTVLKLLTTLYTPMAGVIKVDGNAITSHQRYSFREEVSVVFSDYHLFDRLYGLRDVSDQQANEALRYLSLDRKTKVLAGRFETLQLSGGQRKRLALFNALLEDRPIMIFDEVAADQDPEFRRRFYTEILPNLRAREKMLLVISHDEAYFDVADRRFHMEAGKLTEV
jgi:putative ATP-binding cassette transporter